MNVSVKEYGQSCELLNLHCSWIIPTDPYCFGYAFLFVVFLDSGCSQRDFVIDMIQINFLLYVLRITDALGDLGVI